MRDEKEEIQEIPKEQQHVDSFEVHPASQTQRPLWFRFVIIDSAIN